MEPPTRDAAAPPPAGAEAVPLSVLGERGLLDLVVPGGASLGDVAAAYARHAGLGDTPVLRTELGRPLAPGLRAADLEAGRVVVAVPAGAVPGRTAGPSRGREMRDDARPWAALVLGLAGAAGIAAAAYAAPLGLATARTVTVNVLLAAAVVGILPVGREVHLRSALAPVFGAAAAYVVMWDPRPDTTPVTWAVTALAAAVTAALGRMVLPDLDSEARPTGTDARSDEAHLGWLVGGAAVFLVTVAGVLARVPPAVDWVALLVLVLLAARLVPHYAVSVPDQLLVDLERLAVSAWSAREQPTGRRGRMVIARPMVVGVAQRGQRLVAAACIAIAVVAVVAASLLLGSDLAPVDRLGAELLVLLVGGGLLFAARSYRNPTARAMLRAGGLAGWVLVAGHVVPRWSPEGRAWLVVAALVLGVLCLVSAVATGRGWRSVWWARRAEVAEACCGAFAFAAATAACGALRALWQLTSG